MPKQQQMRFEPGLPRLRVRRSTIELLHSTNSHKADNRIVNVTKAFRIMPRLQPTLVFNKLKILTSLRLPWCRVETYGT